jgi:hypothetical protein
MTTTLPPRAASGSTSAHVDAILAGFRAPLVVELASVVASRTTLAGQAEAIARAIVRQLPVEHCLLAVHAGNLPVVTATAAAATAGEPPAGMSDIVGLPGAERFAVEPSGWAVIHAPGRGSLDTSALIRGVLPLISAGLSLAAARDSCRRHERVRARAG